MSNIFGLLRKTVKRGTKIASNVGKRSTNLVRRVGKMSRKAGRRATNTMGLTRKARRHHRKSHRRQH
jgi:hypothetical protein